MWLFGRIEMKRKSENELLGIEKHLFPLLSRFLFTWYKTIITFISRG